MTPARLAELRSIARMAKPDYQGLAPVGVQRDAIDALPECLEEIERLNAALEDWRSEREEIKKTLGLLGGGVGLRLSEEVSQRIERLRKALLDLDAHAAVSGDYNDLQWSRARELIAIALDKH